MLGTILLGASAWLLFPRERSGTGPTLPSLRVCLVDASASVTRRRPEWAEWIQQVLAVQKSEATTAGEELCVVVFASEVVRAYGPGRAGSFRPESVTEVKMPDRASRLAASVELARALVLKPSRAGGRLVVIGDGTYTGTDPRPALEDLRERGARLEWIDLPPPTLPDLELVSVEAPSEVEEGAPLSIRCELRLHLPAGAAKDRPVGNMFGIGIQWPGSDLIGLRQTPVPIDLATEEDGALRWWTRLDGGRARPGWTQAWVHVGLRGPDGRRDPVPENDSMPFSTRCEGRLVVGFVSERFQDPLTEKIKNTGDLLGAGLQITRVSGAELAGSLSDLDAVVTVDVPPDRLPQDLMQSFVARGGGWLAFAGDRFLPGFSPAGLVDLLPLGAPDAVDPRDVVFLVDRSGSMAGRPFENVRAAVLSLVDMAMPRDAVELRFFSDRLSEATVLRTTDDPRDRPRIRREAAERFSSAQGPGGPTALARSLEALVESRERSGRESIVFLLTDGRDTVDPDARERCPKVLQRLKAAKARLIVVAAGDPPDRELLSTLVAADEDLREVGSLSDPSSAGEIEKVFRRELNKDRVREGASLRVLPAQALLQPSVPATVGAEVLRAQKPESAADWPAIQRYARAKAAPGAEVLWVSETGDPLLALQRVGLGMTAACAFAPIPGWGEAWSGRGDLLAPLLRALARGKRGPDPRLRVEGDTMIVEDVPADSPALLEARVLAAYAREGDPPAAVVLLTPPIEGGDPQRVRAGSMPSSLEDLWDDTLRDREANRDRSARVPRVEIRATGTAAASFATLVLPFELPRPSEFLLPRKHVPREAFDPAGPGAGTAAAGASAAPRPHPAAPALLGASLVLLALAGALGFFGRR